MEELLVVDGEEVVEVIGMPLLTAERLCIQGGNLDLCSAPSAEECCMSREALFVFEELLDGLEEKDRMVLLGWICGFSDEEISLKIEGATPERIAMIRHAISRVMHEAMAEAGYIDPPTLD